MKKARSVILYLLFALTILYPAGVAITACFEYRFELLSVAAFAILLALLAIGGVCLDLICNNPAESKALPICMALLTPFSLINAAFYLFACPRFWVVVGIVIAAECGCFLTVRQGKPLALKIVALVLSALMLKLVILFGFVCWIFGDINTVVKTVESPDGASYANVIDSDQGALGGDTFVEVQKRGIHLILFKIEKAPERVYHGDWGAFNDMEIYWKDEAVWSSIPSKFSSNKVLRNKDIAKQAVALWRISPTRQPEFPATARCRRFAKGFWLF